MSKVNITRVSLEDAIRRKGEGKTDRDRLRREEAAGIEPEKGPDAASETTGLAAPGCRRHRVLQVAGPGLPDADQRGTPQLHEVAQVITGKCRQNVSPGRSSGQSGFDGSVSGKSETVWTSRPGFPGRRVQESLARQAIAATAVTDSNDRNSKRSVADQAQQPEVDGLLEPEVFNAEPTSGHPGLTGITGRRKAIARLPSGPPCNWRDMTLVLSCSSSRDLDHPVRARLPGRQVNGIDHPNCNAQSLSVLKQRDPPKNDRGGPVDDSCRRAEPGALRLQC